MSSTQPVLKAQSGSEYQVYSLGRGLHSGERSYLECGKTYYGRVEAKACTVSKGTLSIETVPGKGPPPMIFSDSTKHLGLSWESVGNPTGNSCGLALNSIRFGTTRTGASAKTGSVHSGNVA